MSESRKKKEVKIIKIEAFILITLRNDPIDFNKNENSLQNTM